MVFNIWAKKPLENKDSAGQPVFRFPSTTVSTAVTAVLNLVVIMLLGTVSYGRLTMQGKCREAWTNLYIFNRRL